MPLLTPPPPTTPFTPLLLPIQSSHTPHMSAADLALPTDTVHCLSPHHHSHPHSYPPPPSDLPTSRPTFIPSNSPTVSPSSNPITEPTDKPSRGPSSQPSILPSGIPTCYPSAQPSGIPSNLPTARPTARPSNIPSSRPSSQPSLMPTSQPSPTPSSQPTSRPSSQPIPYPSSTPTATPTLFVSPTPIPSQYPTPSTSSVRIPTIPPSYTPSCAPTSTLSAFPGSSAFKGWLFMFGAMVGSQQSVHSNIYLTGSYVGSSYVVLGRSKREEVVTLQGQSSWEGVLEVSDGGVQQDSVSRSTMNVGDINRDGKDDWVLGDPSSSRGYVLFGESSSLMNLRVSVMGLETSSSRHRQGMWRMWCMVERGGISRVS